MLEECEKEGELCFFRGFVHNGLEDGVIAEGGIGDKMFLLEGQNGGVLGDVLLGEESSSAGGSFLNF